MSLFRVSLMGDVMLGRGVDQALIGPQAPPEIFESFMRDAREYAKLSGIDPSVERIPDPWGDVLDYLLWKDSDLILFNLETSLTARVPGQPWDKGINYRAHPSRAQFLKQLERKGSIVVVSLANNHILDWGREGLLDTLAALQELNIHHVGAGKTISQAQSPVILRQEKTQIKAKALALALAEGQAKAKQTIVAIWGACDTSSGVPKEWGATRDRSGVWLLQSEHQSPLEAADEILTIVSQTSAKALIKIVSLHYGPNWGPSQPDPWAQAFAHLLIDGGIDLVHMHSSHHPRSTEVYRDRLILYGSGDLINDYEEISGHEQYSPDNRVVTDVSLWYNQTGNNFNGQLVQVDRISFYPKKIQLHLAKD